MNSTAGRQQLNLPENGAEKIPSSEDSPGSEVRMHEKSSVLKETPFHTLSNEEISSMIREADETTNLSTEDGNIQKSDSTDSLTQETLMMENNNIEQHRKFFDNKRTTATTGAESSSTSLTSLNLSNMNFNDSVSSNREGEMLATQKRKDEYNQEDDEDEMESTGNLSVTDEHDDDDDKNNESHDRNNKSPQESPLNQLGDRIKGFRNAVGVFVNNERVQLFIVLLIIVNALQMGVGTLDFVTDSEKVSKGFEATDMAFLVIFTVEIAMQLIYRGLWNVLTDGWLCFDFIIVVSSWSLTSSDLQVLRSFRIFRAFRLITRLTVLQHLVQALFAVAPSVAAIVALLLLILYIFGVLCTELFGPLYEEGVLDFDYFGRLDSSLFTLFQMVTLDWAEIVRQVTVKYYWAWLLFMSFLIITSFILYSLVVAVVCDSVQAVEHENDEDPEEMKKQIQQLQKRVADLTEKQASLLRMLQDSMRQLEDLTESSVDDGDMFYSLPPESDTQAWSPDDSSSTQSSPGKLSQERWRGTFVETFLAPDSPAAASSFELDLTMKRKLPKQSPAD